MDFKLVSSYKPTGDQPEAIKQLTEGVIRGEKYQVLLGVTGSGKTYTVANVINELNRPVLVLSHNKTLAAQLYGEFKSFFPNNAVEYFVSYYDYYQPEAYIPTTDTYIEKDLAINDEIEKLRLSTSSALLSGRRDVIVVSSVSSIYGIGNPEDFSQGTISIKVGEVISRKMLLYRFVESLYSRVVGSEFARGNFRMQGDTIDIFPAYSDTAIRISMWDDEIESIERFDPLNGHVEESLSFVNIYPANIFITSKEKIASAITQIQDDLTSQLFFLRESGKGFEAKRLEDRVTYDMEMMKELGYCSGIENYSRYFDGRKEGSRPFCLIDYFPKDFLMVIDESHVTIPQIHAMYGGDHSRKVNLVEYGFRLPSALDNRPLKFQEFEELTNQVVYVSATPAEYELRKSEGVVVEQVIRPTGLLDPEIVVKPSDNQIDDLIEQIHQRIAKKERVLVTTLTKRMAEELQKYLAQLSIKSQYIHSDVDTFDRVEIIQNLRRGVIDVLVGVNLLREGLDLPEVSLVAILDADKEGFLRSARALTQTAGRAARNVNSLVIMYADKITKSMQTTIDDTERRRIVQINYNIKHGITPTQILRSKEDIFQGTGGEKTASPYLYGDGEVIAAELSIDYMDPDELNNKIKHLRKEMEQAVKSLDFLEAAKYRDMIIAYEERLNRDAKKV